MKKYSRIFFSILFVIFVLGVVFCIVDTLRVHGDEEPIFCFSHKIVDYAEYSAKIDIGLGYKIIQFSGNNEPEIIKVGLFWMSEKSPYVINDENEDNTVVDVPIELSGENVESGEQSVKKTTFGEKYTDSIAIEGMEQEVYAQTINSKLGYSMEYCYDLFDYTGYEDHDKYVWNAVSGDVSSIMTVYDISNEKSYNDSLEEISKEKTFEEISGDETMQIQKAYFRQYDEGDIAKVNYVYIIWLGDLKLRVDLFMPVEAQEGVGAYMKKMVKSIS